MIVRLHWFHFFSSFTFRFFTSKCFRGTYFRQACVTHVGQLRSNDEVQATHLALIRKIIVNLISQITRRDHCVRRYSFAIKASFTSQIHVFPLRFPLMVFTPSLSPSLSNLFAFSYIMLDCYSRWQHWTSACRLLHLWSCQVATHIARRLRKLFPLAMWVVVGMVMKKRCEFMAISQRDHSRRLPLSRFVITSTSGAAIDWNRWTKSEKSKKKTSLWLYRSLRDRYEIEIHIVNDHEDNENQAFRQLRHVLYIVLSIRVQIHP